MSRSKNRNGEKKEKMEREKRVTDTAISLGVNGHVGGVWVLADSQRLVRGVVAHREDVPAVVV
jgi:hypothetical protein